MAMIFVFDCFKKHSKTCAIWAIPCSKDLDLDQVCQRVERSVAQCYSGLSFSDKDGKPLRPKVVAQAVVALARQKQELWFWEYQQRPDYVAVLPLSSSMSSKVGCGLRDVEKMVLKKNGWTSD